MHAVLVLPPELLGDVLFGVVPRECLVAEHLERSVGQRLLQHLLLGRRVGGRVLGGGSGALMMLRAQRVMHNCLTGVCLRGLPFMTSALRGGGGTFKSGHSKQP